MDARYWVVTASADHAARGRQWGIVQAGHGKAAPLKRMQAGDGVVIYSPRETMAAGAPLQAFTAIGRIAAGEPYIFDMGGGFVPWRRAVVWQPGTGHLPIRLVLDQLDLTRGKKAWGMVFRYGLMEMTRHDFAVLARGMLAEGDKALPPAHIDLQ